MNQTPTWTRWTPTELAVLQTFHDSLPSPDHRPPLGYTATLAPLLPGRRVQDIRNGFNVLRRKLAHICNCGAQIDPSTSSTYCPTCRQARKDLREQRLAQGLCGNCGSENKLGLGSSSTMCPSCRSRHQKQNPNYAKRFRQLHGRNDRHSHDPRGSQRILPWPACGHSRWMAELAAAQNRPVIDLFGGTGELLRLVAVYKGHPHAYYDLDPRVANLVAHAVNNQTPMTPEAHDLIFPPGLERKSKATRTRRLKLLGDTLRPTIQHVECRDALDALKDPHQPHNAIFLADPPWPGTNHPALAQVDHKTLLEALFNPPKDQDFILSLGAERQALELVAHALPSTPKGLYWRRSGPFGVKSFLVLSPGLSCSGFAFGLEPITDFSKYGL